MSLMSRFDHFKKGRGFKYSIQEREGLQVLNVKKGRGFKYSMSRKGGLQVLNVKKGRGFKYSIQSF